MGVNTVHLREVCRQQFVSPRHEVIVCVTINGDVEHRKAEMSLCGKPLVHRQHLQGVAQPHRIEHRLQVVIAVRTSLHNVQSQVNLCFWKDYHCNSYLS